MVSLAISAAAAAEMQRRHAAKVAERKQPPPPKPKPPAVGAVGSVLLDVPPEPVGVGGSKGLAPSKTSAILGTTDVQLPYQTLADVREKQRVGFVSDVEKHAPTGTYHTISYRDPYGKVKHVTTRDTSKVVKEIIYPGGISGEVISIAEKRPEGSTYRPLYDASEQIMGTPSMVERYTWKDIEPTLTPQMTFILGHQRTPERKKSLEAQYERFMEGVIFGGVQKGTGKKFTPEMLGQAWQDYYIGMPEPAKIEFATKFLGYKEPVAPKQDEPSLAGKVGAYVFMPFGERIGYAQASLTETRFKPGTLTPVKGANLFEGKGMVKVREQGEQIYLDMWKKGDWAGTLIRGIQNPVVVVPLSYGAGLGMGALKATAWASKPIVIQSPMGPTAFAVTRGTAIEAGVGGYFATEMGKGGVEAYKAGQLGKYIGTAAVMMPFIMLPYKYGSRAGMGWVQRKAAMAKLTGIERTQQQALFEVLKITRKLGEPRYDVSPYDITKVELVGPREARAFTSYSQSFRARYIHKAAIGGSTAMEIQMPEGWFRSGGYPKRVIDIASSRQRWAFEMGLQKGPKVKPVKITGVPGDIDILFRGIFAKGKSPTVSKLESFSFHVHKSPVGSYRGFGETLYPSVKGKIISGKGIIDVKTMSIREQFLRTTTNLLPSEQMITGHRAFKDVPTWFDVGKSLTWQKGGTKLRIAMDKFLYPEQHPVPKVTMGERFISRIGGAVQPKYFETPGGYIQRVYPKSIYPKSYIPYTLAAGGYLVTPYTVSYKPSSYISSKSPTYKPSTYKPSKMSTGISTYKPPRYPPDIPTYKPISYPPSKPPSYKPTVYKPISYPPSKPPSYKPTVYKPISYPPSKPSSYPPYKPPGYIPPSKPHKPSDSSIKKKHKKEQGFDVYVKDRYIYHGKPRKPQQFKKVNKRAMSQRDAMSFGSTIVDNTAGASFKIKPSSSKAQEMHPNIRTYIKPWSFQSYKFYSPPKKKKTKAKSKHKVYIEKTTFRIDTPGEVKGISSLGWVATKRKSFVPSKNIMGFKI